jgi:HAD superfamily phosphoserine phosphatase-like hydrolase
VKSILQLEPRLAVFDCDGTLWPGDAGERFFDWEMREGLVPGEIERWARPRYAEYRAGKVPEEVMCGEMVTMHREMIEADVQRAATRFFDICFHDQIFPEMRELVELLQRQGCEVWAVSSTNVWVIRAAVRHFGIPSHRVLAAQVKIDKGRVTDQLVRVPSGDGKVRAIREVIKKDPDVAFGNSRWDQEMLEISGQAVAVNPNPDLERVARERDWMVYVPDGP